jgi:hypothetical protein
VTLCSVVVGYQRFGRPQHDTASQPVLNDIMNISNLFLMRGPVVDGETPLSGRFATRRAEHVAGAVPFSLGAASRDESRWRGKHAARRYFISSLISLGPRPRVYFCHHDSTHQPSLPPLGNLYGIWCPVGRPCHRSPTCLCSAYHAQCR